MLFAMFESKSCDSANNEHHREGIIPDMHIPWVFLE